MKDDPIISGLGIGFAIATVAIGAEYVVEKVCQWATFTPEQRKLLEDLKAKEKGRG